MPIGILAQSSGYGQTRSLYEYAKKRVTVYLCLGSRSREESFPHRSHLANSLESAFLDEDGKPFLLALIQSTLDELRIIEQKRLNVERLNEMAREKTRLEANELDDGNKFEEIFQLNKRLVVEEATAIEFMKSQPWLDYPCNTQYRVSNSI